MNTRGLLELAAHQAKSGFTETLSEGNKVERDWAGRFSVPPASGHAHSKACAPTCVHHAHISTIEKKKEKL